MKKPAPTPFAPSAASAALIPRQPGGAETALRPRRAALKAVPLWLGAFCLGLAGITTPARAVETAAFEIVARDGRLFPERLDVPANVKLRLTLRNEGRAPVEFENLELRVEKVLAPDSAAVVTVQPLKPGSYTFIDDFHADTGKMLLIAK